jgi:hypothetical protein
MRIVQVSLPGGPTSDVLVIAAAIATFFERAGIGLLGTAYELPVLGFRNTG